MHSDEILSEPESIGVPCTVSAPFERFVDLKDMIGEHTGDRNDLDEDRDAFESRDYRVGYGEYKVVVSNKRDSIADPVRSHEGRSAQEGIFAELKSENGFASVPTRTWLGIRAYPSAALIAHNLTREQMMQSAALARPHTTKRSPLWIVRLIATVCCYPLQLVGRPIKPQRTTDVLDGNQRCDPPANRESVARP